MILQKDNFLKAEKFHNLVKDYSILFTSQGQKSTVRGQCIDFISSFRHIVCIIFSYTRKSFNIPQEGEMFLL